MLAVLSCLCWKWKTRFSAKITERTGVEASRTALTVESEAIAKRSRLRTAAPAAPTLAYRCFLHQRLRDLLLPVQCSGRVQSFYLCIGTCENQ
jgi:hypothetical protein